jgi:antitoxin HicB
MQQTYHALFEVDPDGGFIVTFPDIPEASTAGIDAGEAIANAVDALEVTLLGYLADGRPLPDPAHRGSHLRAVSVSAATGAKLALIEAFRESGLSKSELARRMGKAETEVRRMLDPFHRTKLPAIEAALLVLGKRLLVRVDAAA